MTIFENEGFDIDSPDVASEDYMTSQRNDPCIESVESGSSSGANTQVETRCFRGWKVFGLICANAMVLSAATVFEVIELLSNNNNNLNGDNTGKDALKMTMISRELVPE